MYEQIFALLTCSDQTRSAEAVQERLDRLIGEIYKLQTPHMDGKSGQPADVLVVRMHLSSPPLNVTSLKLFRLGSTRPHLARIREEMASLPHEFPLYNDDGARRHRYYELCASQCGGARYSGRHGVSSSQVDCKGCLARRNYPMIL